MGYTIKDTTSFLNNVGSNLEKMGQRPVLEEDPSTLQNMWSSAVNEEFIISELPRDTVSEFGDNELIILAVYLPCGTIASSKFRLMAAEIKSSMLREFKECGKDIRIVVLGTQSQETKIECIYPTKLK